MMRVLRLIAVAIAIAGLVDPAISLSGASRARLAIITPQASSSAAEVRSRLIRDLSSSYEIVSDVTSDAAAAVVIGDRYPDQPLPETLMVSTVTLPADAISGVRIIRVDAPRDVPPATAIHLEVDVEGAGVVGSSTEVTATIAGVETGRVSHRWTANPERWRASLDAVPVGGAPYVLRIGADRSVADVVVDARRAPLEVEFFDPRPSWATTFVRRALEADARVQVSSLSFTSRGVSVQTGSAVPLGDPRLDRFQVVVIGGLERLSAGDAHALERFMRERGGAVIAIPDQRVDAGPARDLIAVGDVVERLLEQPAKLTTAPAASLQASEFLVVRALPPGGDIVARLPGNEAQPVMVSSPRGDGRLLFSGAMDAWRYRAADSGAFDRFWQSTIAGLALAVPPPIAIEVEPPLLRPGESADVIVRIRARDVTAVSATIDGDQPVRLRPEPATGVYQGRFTAQGRAARSTVEVRVAGAQSADASRTFLVQRDVQRVRPTAAPSLAMLATSHRGVDVTPQRLGDLERFVRNAITPPRVTSVVHPMRSVWWIVPFAACLSAEWWLRRRRGLR